MSKFKRFLSVGLAALLAAGLAGCSGGKETSEASGTESDTRNAR